MRFQDSSAKRFFQERGWAAGRRMACLPQITKPPNPNAGASSITSLPAATPRDEDRDPGARCHYFSRRDELPRVSFISFQSPRPSICTINAFRKSPTRFQGPDLQEPDGAFGFSRPRFTLFRACS